VGAHRDHGRCAGGAQRPVSVQFPAGRLPARRLSSADQRVPRLDDPDRLNPPTMRARRVPDPAASRAIDWPVWAALVVVALAALLVRGYVYWGRSYLSGTDYGQVVLQA